jgi:hypothetical protein
LVSVQFRKSTAPSRFPAPPTRRRRRARA